MKLTTVTVIVTLKPNPPFSVTLLKLFVPNFAKSDSQTFSQIKLENNILESQTFKQ